ncbi:hypothetical protein IWW38_005910, partial [Coemansia aciculifera]
MDLDPPEQRPQEEEEEVDVAATAAITPPHSTSISPLRNNNASARDMAPSSEQQNREIDSAAPESPGGSLYYGDTMEGISSSDEDKNDRATEATRPPTRPSRR